MSSSNVTPPPERRDSGQWLKQKELDTRRTELKERVLETDPNHGRCIVENCDPSRIEHCHIVPISDWKDYHLVRRGSGSGTHGAHHRY